MTKEKSRQHQALAQTRLGKAPWRPAEPQEVTRYVSPVNPHLAIRHPVNIGFGVLKLRDIRHREATSLPSGGTHHLERTAAPNLTHTTPPLLDSPARNA